MSDCIRVVECGGSGFRSADVCQGDITLANCADIEMVPSVESLIRFATNALPENTKAIIFPAAGVIRKNRIIASSPNIPLLRNVDLPFHMASVCNIPSFVVGDMESSVVGAAELFPSLSYFMNMTWSTGIGARIWKNGGILSESEIGHMIADPSPLAPLCGCGHRGCFEAFLGGKAIKKRVISECETSGLKIPENMHPCKFLDVEYKSGSFWALDLYERIIEQMALYLCNLQMALKLPAIVWKGTFAYAFFTDLKLGQNLKEEMRQFTTVAPEWIDDLEFCWDDPQNIENRDSFIGAAKIARELLAKR